MNNDKLRHFAPLLKKGALLKCIKDDHEDVDFGASGIVFYGKRELHANRLYKVHSWDLTDVPKGRHRDSVWRDEPKEVFDRVRRYWVWVDVRDTVTNKLIFRNSLDHFEFVEN